MTIPKRWRPFVLAAAGHYDHRTEQNALRILEEDRIAKSRARAKKAPSRATKRAEGVARMNRTARIREALIARAGGLCEACGAPGSDMHHTISGNGSRRVHEELDTVVLVCRPCHDLAHKGDQLTLARLWATPGLSGAAMTALERRMTCVP